MLEMLLSPRRKNFAVIYICSCDEVAFSVATSIMSFEKTNPSLADNYIIFCDRDMLTQATRNIFLKISRKIIFRDFIRENLLNKIKNKDSYLEKRWTYLIYAKVYLIDYLKKYKNVLFLGGDTLVIDDISDIVSFGPLAWRETAKKLNESTDTKIDGIQSKPNGDFIFMNSEIDMYTSEDLFKILNENEYYEGVAPEEFAYAMLAYLKNIKVNVLSKIYLCLMHNTVLKDAKIIHAHANKFWKLNVVKVLFPEFEEYYQKWLQLGGMGYTGKVIGPANFPSEKKDVLPWCYRLEVLAIFYKSIFRKLPDCIKPSLETYKNTVPFYILDKSDNVRYYIHFKYGKAMHIGFLYSGERNDAVRTVIKEIATEVGENTVIDENKKNICCYSILDEPIAVKHSTQDLPKKLIEQNADAFLNFIMKTLHIVMNSDELK